MDRHRARSASPLVQLRTTARSFNSLAKSPLGASQDILSPRTISNANLDVDDSKSATKSGEGSENSSRYSLHSGANQNKSKSFGDLLQATQVTSTERLSIVNVSPGGSALARSKTSYSIHFELLSQIEGNSKAMSSSSLNGLKLAWDVLFEAPDSTETSASDGIMREIDQNQFAGLWNHPVARLYFLMYLIWRGQENLFLLRMEIIDFRSNFFKLPSPTTRISSAKRIKKLYLMPDSPLFVEFPEYLVDPSVDDIIDRIFYMIDNADVSIYDDLAYAALQSMEHAYRGQFNPIVGENEKQFVSFRQSGFYQALRNDLRGTFHVTEAQYRRVIERVTEMCNLYSVDISKWEMIISYLEDITLDAETKLIQKRKQNYLLSSNTISRSMVNLGDEVSSSPARVASPRSPIQWSGVDHTFLPSSKNEAYCEYCFEKSSQKPSGDEIYLCETCGICCHKNCRNQIQISCIKFGIEKEAVGLEQSSEQMRMVQEKLDALEREVNIELKIQEGIDKLTKAKYDPKASKSKKAKTEKDLSAQLEKNTKRLEALKHEMQKRKIQLQTLQKEQENPGLANKKKLRLANESGNSSSLSNLPMMDTGLLRVIAVDPVTKSEFKKAIYITENQSTVEVIETVLSKTNLGGTPNSFQLSYKLNGSEQVKILKDEDRPMQIEDLDYAQTWFHLTARSEVKPITKDDPLLKKQQEILMEIIESDQKYLDDLKLIQTAFMEPMNDVKILTESEANDIFHNLDEIIKIHERIIGEIAQASSHQAKLSKLIECFGEAIKDFNCYQKYCGNQYQQRHAVKHKQSTNVAFARLLQKCETNPKLQKLNFSDMLMKPMQKITRYPLLFKRMLPNLPKPSPEHDGLAQLLTELEKSIGEVNETVRNKEARYKIKLIDETMDFGVAADKFKIESENRTLIQEKTLQYINKVGTPIEVVVFLFSDVILIARRSKKADGGYILFKPPIPLEQTTFIDRSDTENLKRIIQIVHQQHEIHNIQAYSVFDKTAWLQEAEATRAKYCNTYYTTECTYSRSRLVRYKNQVLPPRSQEVETPVSKTGSFFFRRKPTDANENNLNHDEDSATRRISKRMSSILTPSSYTDKPENKITAQELLNAKKRLSHSPSRNSLLMLSSSIRNLARGSPESTLPRPVQILPSELTQAKQHLSPTRTSKPISPLARSALHAEIVRSPRKLAEKTSSSANLFEKIKNTFRKSQEELITDAVQMEDISN